MTLLIHNPENNTDEVFLPRTWQEVIFLTKIEDLKEVRFSYPN